MMILVSLFIDKLILCLHWRKEMSGLFNFANMSDGLKITETLNKRKKIF